MDRRLILMRERVGRALGDQPVAAAVRKIRAIVGPRNIPDTEPLAQAALDKLRANGTPTSEELQALEIVLRLMRPVVFSRNDALEDLPDNPGDSLHPHALATQWASFRDQVAPWLGSIGRVESKSGQHYGTGFLVAPGLLATNRHVLSAMTFGTDWLASGAARVVFKQEEGLINSPNDIVPIESVEAIHPTLDIALLSLAPGARKALPLSVAPPAESGSVVAIGFPARDVENNPRFLAGVFNDKFGVKRAALGEVLDGVSASALFHDCSTTKGNSGSPLFCLDTAEVTGIHRSGLFMYRNEAIPASELRAFVEETT
jgi:hypothetical protein